MLSQKDLSMYLFPDLLVISLLIMLLPRPWPLAGHSPWTGTQSTGLATPPSKQNERPRTLLEVLPTGRIPFTADLQDCPDWGYSAAAVHLQLVPAYYMEPARSKAWVFPSSVSCPQRTPHETMCTCWRCGKRKDRIWALPCAFKAWVAQTAWRLGGIWNVATWQGPSYKGDLGSGGTGLIRKETPQV